MTRACSSGGQSASLTTTRSQVRALSRPPIGTVSEPLPPDLVVAGPRTRAPARHAEMRPGRVLEVGASVQAALRPRIDRHARLRSTHHRLWSVRQGQPLGVGAGVENRVRKALAADLSPWTVSVPRCVGSWVYGPPPSTAGEAACCTLAGQGRLGPGHGSRWKEGRLASRAQGLRSDDAGAVAVGDAGEPDQGRVAGLRRPARLTGRPSGGGTPAELFTRLNKLL